MFTATAELTGATLGGRADVVLSDEALAFVAALQHEFGSKRTELLELRRSRQGRIDSGELPDFLAETKSVRDGGWKILPEPAQLMNRRCEITGPVDRKMMINALNSGADVFMADFEDSLTPTWENVVMGQVNLIDAVERTLELTQGEKNYRLNPVIATLFVRPRGWHLPEKHVLVDGTSVSASLFDAGMYLFHCSKRRLDQGMGTYFYLPKLESHLEARLWNDIFSFAEEHLGLPTGTVRATVLIETILAAFEMEEILYELRDHSAGLNAGRWDYIFSVIKKFHSRPEFVLPDRSQILMTVPFMRAYTDLLIATCHKRGAHAIGGMAAFIPNRKDPELNAKALAKVADDKERESHDGFDGTWVAHPDLVAIAHQEFEVVLQGKESQLDRQRQEVRVSAADLLKIEATGGTITEKGLRTNIRVGIEYLASWLGGNGAAALHNLMEDAATAEISRSQLWQWVTHSASLDDGRTITRELVETIMAEEMSVLAEAATPNLEIARELFAQVALSPNFVEFLTLPAYDLIN